MNNTFLQLFRIYSVIVVICMNANLAISQETRPPQSILYAEYFWDDDPGYGKGTPITVTDGNALVLENYEISTEALQAGNHIFGMRTYGTSGWSPTALKEVSVMKITPDSTETKTQQSILYAEYFWDDDPGFGKGVPITVTDGNALVLENYEISTEALQAGNHIFGMRTYGTSGWSPTALKEVSVMKITPDSTETKTPQSILYAEYFWDDDPGFGKGVPITVSNGDSLVLDNYEISTQNLTAGDHVFGFRTLGTTGWSPTALKEVSVMKISTDSIEARPPQSILYAEYFWDDDPGFGKGTPIPVNNGDSLVLDNYEISTKRLVTGDHVFGFRTLGTTGWSPTELSIISVVNDVIPGDVNNDGELTLSDPICIFSWLLEQEPPVFVEERADFNEDGRISSSDGVAIILHLLKDESANMAPAKNNTENKVMGYDSHTDGFDIQFGPLSDITAMMMDMTLPDGVSLNSASLDGTHSVTISQVGHNTFRMATFSLDMATIGKGAVLHCKTSGGQPANVDISNIRLVDSQTKEWGATAVNCSPTGIRNLGTGTATTSMTNDSRRYDISGRAATGSTRGIVISQGKKYATPRR